MLNAVVLNVVMLNVTFLSVAYKQSTHLASGIGMYTVSPV
jgi:hypothetical protein